MECHGEVDLVGGGATPLPFGALQQVEERPGVDIVSVEKDGGEPEEEKYILCRSCGNAVTSDQLRMEAGGSHEHTFVNPAGVMFRIGCFSGAGGCLITGIPTTEYTWFPGFAWCYVVCSGCLTHLGWHYRSGASGFFGLILDRLTRR